ITDSLSNEYSGCMNCKYILKDVSDVSLFVCVLSFATHCDKRGNFLRCVCQEGYAGHYCERCAPGFYGNPMELGNSCKKCDCNGNSDPNLIFNECNNVTGQCLNCWGNTSGDNCERCAPGFYGDAISAKDCRECQCDKCGTASCDDRTGVCHCKPGITGHLCDRCEEGYSGFGSCMGCRRCECASAALRATCHPLTHSCQCRPGAGGRYCERCLPGFWDYSPSGCKSESERSHCIWHDSLLEQVQPISVSVLFYCDACIWSLIGDIRQSNKTLDQVRNSVLNISTGAAANDRLKYYNYTAHRLQVTTLKPHTVYRNVCPDDVVFHKYCMLLSLCCNRIMSLKSEMTNVSSMGITKWLLHHSSTQITIAMVLFLLFSNLKGSDANGHVQKALNALNVYDNIVKNIDDANITALTALNISSSTHDAMTSPNELLMDKGSNLKQIYCACWPFSLLNLRRIMKSVANVFLLSLHMFICMFLVQDLSEIVPELLSKLRVVEEKKPVNNVSTNIVKIRELIAQARSVAKKVQVSMKFNGQSSVEVRPHSNLDELKTVTSISFYIRVDPDKDPIEDRFLLYLGDKQGRKDYMGLAIKNDNLVYVYNLGGEVVEIPLGSKPVSSWPPVFNLVKVERLGRHGKLFLTVPSQDSTAEQKFIQKGEADGIDSLFDLDPKDNVFIVGGVPPDVKLPPALTLAPFVGCIELEALNSDVISLYNFKQLHKMDVVESMPCPRHKLAFSQSRVTSYLFDGSGYALVNNFERRGKLGIVTRFDIEVRTVANNGILFLMVNEANFFVLELKNGFLRLMYDFGFTNGPVIMESNLAKLQINDARYHEVSVIYHHSKKIILLVDKSHIKSMENEKKPLPFSDVYIGGAPSSILLSRPELSSLVGLKGCVKGFQFQKNLFNLLEEQGTIGISSGCPEESFMSRKVYFTGDGYLGSTAKISPFQSFEGGLNFRTLQSNGLLFYHRNGLDEFSLSLENGAVVLQSKGTRVRSQKKNYNDGRSHFLVASVTNQKYELVIDDKDKQDKKKPSSSSQPDNVPKTFYYGGSPTSSIQNFTGCISYAYLSRQDRDIEPEDFQHYSENVQVSLQDCPLERPPAALHIKDSRDSSRRSPGHSRKVGRDVSSLPHGLKNNPLDVPETEAASSYLSSRPRVTRHAHHYGGFAHSRHDVLCFSIFFRSHFSLSLKTQSAFGLIFYLADESEENFMALFLTHGRLVFTFSSAQNQVRIRSKEKYSDGQWHDIIFIRSGNIGRLIIDGLTVLEDRAPGGNISLLVQDPLFVGGVPPDQAKKNIQKMSVSGFSGCVRSLQLNGRWLTSASHSFGVTPCYEGPSEPGTYFTEEGGYVLLDDSFNFGSRLKMVIEVRPRVASGVLLHVFTGEKEYLTLYTYQNQVVVVVNNGIREFSTYVSPRQEICDGNWHKITVIRDGNMVQLDVDSEVNHVVGPVGEAAQNSSSPVFIGGAPDSMLPHSLHSRRGYTGCMRNLSVNESPVSFSKAALVSGAVGVGACPAA
uniref:Laminin, alpha 4 n=2 Tax=Cyprinus carpio TaxID=7962 RepID=A0A8C1LIC4_CYPCA